MPFKISLVDNWKKLLSHSAVMWMVYIGTAAEIALSFMDLDLTLWQRLLFLGAIGGGRLVQQHLSTKELTKEESDDDSQIPLGI